MGGVNNYSCVSGIIDGNSFSGFREHSSGAINISTGYNHAQSICSISNNQLLDASISLVLSGKPNIQVSLDNNTCVNGRWVLRGDGSNISSTNNTIKHVRGSGVNAPAFYQDGLLEASGNTLIGTSMSATSVFVEHSSAMGGNNILFVEGTGRFKLNNSGSDLATKYFNDVELRSKSGVSRFNLETGRLAAENTLDKWSVSDVVFDGTILGTLQDGTSRDIRNTILDISDSTFKNGAYIEIAKNELSNAGSTIVVIKNCYIDVTNLSQVIRNSYTTRGTREFVFINCTFFSSVPKSLPVLTAPTVDAGATITSRAIKCNFVNVTNSDSFTVIS